MCWLSPHLNPRHVQWESDGVLARRLDGRLVLKKVVDNTGCLVNLVYEGGGLTHGSALDYVIQRVKAVCTNT
jgi:hypothetical protein